MKLSLRDRKPLLTMLILTLLMGVSARVVSDEIVNRLYQAELPANTGLVRLFNGRSESIQFAIRMSTTSRVEPDLQQAGPNTFSAITSKPTALASNGLSNFYPLTAGHYQLWVAGKSFDFELPSASAINLVVNADNIKLITAGGALNDRKALLHLLNLTTTEISLATLKNEVTLIGLVPSFQQSSRQVNEANLPLAAWSVKGAEFRFPKLYFRRGASYTYWVRVDNGQLTGGVIRDRVEKPQVH